MWCLIPMIRQSLGSYPKVTNISGTFVALQVRYVEFTKSLCRYMRTYVKEVVLILSMKAHALHAAILDPADMLCKKALTL